MCLSVTTAVSVVKMWRATKCDMYLKTQQVTYNIIQNTYNTFIQILYFIRLY